MMKCSDLYQVFRAVRTYNCNRESLLQRVFLLLCEKPFTLNSGEEDFNPTSKPSILEPIPSRLNTGPETQIPRERHFPRFTMMQVYIYIYAYNVEQGDIPLSTLIIF